MREHLIAGQNWPKLRILPLRELKRHTTTLWIYDVAHGALDVGRLESVHLPDGWKKRAHSWRWRLTPFDIYGPAGIGCYGRANDQASALEAPAAMWQRFLDLSDMALGALRLRPQPDHAEGLADNHVYAGDFRLGRIHQDRDRFDVHWKWIITGFHGYTSCRARDRDHAMASIKAGWRSIYGKTQAVAVNA